MANATRRIVVFTGIGLLFIGAFVLIYTFLFRQSSIGNRVTNQQTADVPLNDPNEVIQPYPEDNQVAVDTSTPPNSEPLSVLARTRFSPYQEGDPRWYPPSMIGEQLVTDDSTAVQQLSETTEQTTSTDPDADGLSNVQEQTIGTDSENPDSDGDGLNDGDEVTKYRTSPLNFDTDGDGLMDDEEVNEYGTDPTKADTDGDGFDDGTEVRGGYNPLGSGMR